MVSMVTVAIWKIQKSNVSFKQANYDLCKVSIILKHFGYFLQTCCLYSSETMFNKLKQRCYRMLYLNLSIVVSMETMAISHILNSSACAQLHFGVRIFVKFHEHIAIQFQELLVWDSIKRRVILAAHLSGMQTRCQLKHTTVYAMYLVDNNHCLYKVTTKDNQNLTYNSYLHEHMLFCI